MAVNVLDSPDIFSCWHSAKEISLNGMHHDLPSWQRDSVSTWICNSWWYPGKPIPL